MAGWVFVAAGGATNWQSQKQKCIAQSTVEAEYMAACAACKEAVWQTAVWGQAGLSSDDPMVILCDNQGAMALAKNPEHHARSKHIDVRYHYVRQVVADGVVRLEYVASANQAADQLTKPLSKPQHEPLLGRHGHSLSTRICRLTFAPPHPAVVGGVLEGRCSDRVCAFVLCVQSTPFCTADSTQILSGELGRGTSMVVSC